MSQKKSPSDKNSMKILTKLVLIVGASILVSCISVAVVSLFMFDKEIMEDTMSQLDYTAYGIEAIMEDWEKTLEGNVKMLSEQEEMHGLIQEQNQANIQEYCKRVAEELGLDLLVIMDDSGIVMGGDGKLAPGMNFSSLLTVRETLQGNANYTVEEVYSVGFCILSAAP
ncbi:MAG: hypothetical protein IKW26_05995, partial [Treponema sp.]|nr:hypothetical protein [Treponema sp.]